MSERMHLLHRRAFKYMQLDIKDYPEKPTLDEDNLRFRISNLILKTSGLNQSFTEIMCKKLKGIGDISILNDLEQRHITSLLLEHHKLISLAPSMFITTWGGDQKHGRGNLSSKGNKLVLDRFTGAGYTQTSETPNALAINLSDKPIKIEYLNIQPEFLLEISCENFPDFKRVKKNSISVDDINIMEYVPLGILIDEVKSVTLRPRESLLFPTENIITMGRQNHNECLFIRGYMMPEFSRVGKISRTDTLEVREVSSV